jgi:poly(3-hydroxybutyrate) depolymerase
MSKSWLRSVSLCVLAGCGDDGASASASVSGDDDRGLRAGGGAPVEATDAGAVGGLEAPEPPEADAAPAPPVLPGDADDTPVTPADAGDAPPTPDAAVPPAVPDATVEPPPPGRDDPPPLPAYGGGVCPVFAGGPTLDASLVTGFPSGGDQRSFRMIVPPNYDGSEPWPVMFAWHWLNASSSSFVNQGELESAAEEMRFLIVVPDHLENANGDKTYLLNWPFAEVWGAEKELQFFDDLLACVDANFNVDPRQIHGVGVSAGALWLAHLTSTSRADHLATAVSLSGGLGRDPFGVWDMMFTPQAHRFPAIVLWGGPTDNLVVVDFAAASTRLMDALIGNGHFVVSCTHDSGHAVPPIEAPPDGGTRFRFLWRFMAEHPYGTPAGTSPWQQAGLPPETPPWCEIATP